MVRALASRWVGTGLAVVVAASCSVTSLDDLKGSTAGPDAGGAVGADGGDASDEIGSDGWACSPKTCASAGADCGQISDGCNGTLECGTCAAAQACNANHQCECVPATCASLGKQCGSEPDGCGASLDCGTCGTGETCSSGQCVCQPKTCASEGWSCGGPLDDGCGNQLSCGACTDTSTCINHTCQQGMVLSCGACPAGFSSPFGVSNSTCGAQTTCGQVVQNICVLDGLAYASGCGGQCPAQYHLAGALDHCACPSSVNFCIPD